LGEDVRTPEDNFASHQQSLLHSNGPINGCVVTEIYLGHSKATWCYFSRLYRHLISTTLTSDGHITPETLATMKPAISIAILVLGVIGPAQAAFRVSKCWQRCARSIGIQCKPGNMQCICNAANQGLLTRTNRCACDSCEHENDFGKTGLSLFHFASISRD